ncbi:MAG: bifunctional (p)ppGpp synthetase/guanosine-3',5'-bis(diphosphate) 3'-pyrophosphohydrolase [Candidatus Nealsonbacteria bacterium]|nr:bifunctional (p)ppGpp synthetase/guanosine-3',5'-bis(diphosphate) 3'-pyrophosphohydrolase [Candidatus Nealsonbacteria bacterium]
MAVGRVEFEKKLKEKIDLTPREFQLIMLAYKLAKYGHGHKGQMRDDGKIRYFEHPKAVALILIEENTRFIVVKPWQIVAALLHDIKENTFILSWKDIELIFGKRVRKSVRIMTKDEVFRGEVYFKRLSMASSEDIDNKLADRLHNMRTLGDCSSEKQKEYLKETVDFYLPLAKKRNGYLYFLLEQECKKYANKELP